MRVRFAAALALFLGAAPASAQGLSLNDFLEVAGQVRAIRASPIENALVIAFSLSDDLNLQTSTGREGTFALPALPVGVYRVVAVKRGFLPAFMTVTPTKKAHTLILELENRETASDVRKADAWTLRRSLPKDVLRAIEVELADQHSDTRDGASLARFAGHMESVAGYSGVSTERSLEKAAVAFHSNLGTWALEFRGSRQLIDQGQSFDTAEPAAAADVVLEVRSSPSNAYHVTSTRASWSQPQSKSGDVGVETHSLAWYGSRSSIQVRYLSHENVFPDREREAEDTLEVAGDAVVYRGRHSDVGVSLRIRQDSVIGSTGVDGLEERFADLATNARHTIAEGLGVEYGVLTRIGDETLEIMPQAAAELRVGDNARIQLAGAYKFDTTPGAIRRSPGIGHLGESPTIDTRYKYSIALSSDLGDSAEFSLSARRAAADALTFLLFDDRFDEFWDGLYLRRGDVLSDGILSVQADIGALFDLAIITSAGSVESLDSDGETKQYVTGEIRTHFEPTGTSLDVAYRMLEQPDLVDEKLLREIERISVVVGQSLHLPIDLRLLLGFSVANHGEVATSIADDARNQRRVMGGLSFSF